MSLRKIAKSNIASVSLIETIGDLKIELLLTHSLESYFVISNGSSFNLVISNKMVQGFLRLLDLQKRSLARFESFCLALNRENPGNETSIVSTTGDLQCDTGIALFEDYVGSFKLEIALIISDFGQDSLGADGENRYSKSFLDSVIRVYNDKGEEIDFESISMDQFNKIFRFFSKNPFHNLAVK